MPIEIRELHIKVTVNAGQQNKASASQGQPSRDGEAGGALPSVDEIVTESVEQVLEILRNKKER